MTHSASPALVYHASMDLACTYALRNPTLACELATDALRAAIRWCRPDMAYRANALIAALVSL